MSVQKYIWLLLALAVFVPACSRSGQPDAPRPTSMKEIPAGRLNYLYEADVPAPTVTEPVPSAQELNAAIQADFDQNRAQEALDKTIASPDGKRNLAVYHRVGDMLSEFRLDMYTSDGRILRNVTADAMAVHFPDTIVWSPNSENVAFVAMVRAPQAPAATPSSGAAEGVNANTSTTPSNVNTNAGVPDAAQNSNAEPLTQPRPQPPAGPSNVLTFHTEQIYLANSDGDGLKPITQNDGLIYFYYVWAPDSSALAATAITAREWQFYQAQADGKGESFVPVGRARIVEKNGRERRLDDTLSAVRPVWSPDSSKVAVAFDMQIRVYDAAANSPTQAAIPLRNNLLLSSAAYDKEQARKLQESGVEIDTNQQAAPAANTETPGASTLPDPNTLVSFNPIVALSWPSDDLLYLQTAYIKRMKNEMDSRSSFQRWHRLVFTPQPVTGN